jgi:hypothetical protein
MGMAERGDRVDLQLKGKAEPQAAYRFAPYREINASKPKGNR